METSGYLPVPRARSVNKLILHRPYEMKTNYFHLKMYRLVELKISCQRYPILQYLTLVIQ